MRSGVHRVVCHAAVSLLGACGPVGLEFSQGVSSQAPLSVSTREVFAAVNALTPEQKSAAFATIGSWSFAEYYDFLLAHVTTEAAMVDGVAVGNSRQNLLDNHDFLVSLGKIYPTVAALWHRLKLNPAAFTYADLQSAMRSTAPAAKLDLDYRPLPYSNPLCDDMNASITTLFGFNANELAGFATQFVQEPGTGTQTYPGGTNGQSSAKFHTGANGLIFTLARPGFSKKFNADYANHCLEWHEPNQADSDTESTGSCPASSSSQGRPTGTRDVIWAATILASMSCGGP